MLVFCQTDNNERHKAKSRVYIKADARVYRKADSRVGSKAQSKGNSRELQGV